MLDSSVLVKLVGTWSPIDDASISCQVVTPSKFVSYCQALLRRSSWKLVTLVASSGASSWPWAFIVSTSVVGL